MDRREPSDGRASLRRDELGQTAIDFLVGMSVFLLAVGFVFAFTPTMFQPFSVGGTGDAMQSDRIATLLTESVLVEHPSEPGVLSTPCTVAFFDEDEPDEEDDCNFNHEDVDDLSVLLGLNDGTNVEITIGGPDNELEWEDEEITMQHGDDSSTADSVTVSRRVVLIDGSHETLRVTVW